MSCTCEEPTKVLARGAFGPRRDRQTSAWPRDAQAEAVFSTWRKGGAARQGAGWLLGAGKAAAGPSLPAAVQGGAAAASIVTPSHGPDFRGGKVAVCVWCRPAAAAAGQECAQVPDRPSAPLPSVRGRARQLRGERPVRVPVGQRVAGRLCTAVAPRRHRVRPLHVTGVSGPNAHACPPGTTGRPKRMSPSGPGRGVGASFGDPQASRASASSGQGREGPGPGELRVQSP